MLSNDAQKRTLLEYAENHNIEIVDIYVESQSAYKKGRPLFNKMLNRIEAGEVDCILTYHLTRLARNSFDGGRIIYMMDDDVIKKIITIYRPL